MGLDFDESSESVGVQNEEEAVAPYIDVLSKFRDQVREAARAKVPSLILIET